VKRLALLVCLAFLACERTPVPAKAPAAKKEIVAPAIERDVDADNLLNLAYGAAVVSRTGEMNLETSAAHAIDGFHWTSWFSSPGAPDEVLVYSLLAPSRLTQVGVTPLEGDHAIRKIAFDTSMDGREWRELATMQPENNTSRQLVSVPETVTRYIRIRSLEKQSYSVRARGFHAIGTEVSPPDTPPFTGCWTVNGRRAHVLQTGARITGRIESDPPLLIDGGTDNRVALAVWTQGASWGYAALTRTPDGKHLTGIRFYEQFDSKTLADAWFGERCTSQAAATAAEGSAPAVALAFLRHAGTYPLYGLVFDSGDRLVPELSAGALDVLVALLGSTSQPVRVVSHEVRYDTAEENRRHTAARIEAVRAALQSRGVNVGRIDFVSAGNDWTEPVLRATIQRYLASRVEISFGT
jgi:hypothetical protein